MTSGVGEIVDHSERGSRPFLYKFMAFEWGAVCFADLLCCFKHVTLFLIDSIVQSWSRVIFNFVPSKK